MTPDELKGYNAGIDRALAEIMSRLHNDPACYREELVADALAEIALVLGAAKMPAITGWDLAKRPDGTGEWLWTGPAAGD